MKLWGYKKYLIESCGDCPWYETEWHFGEYIHSCFHDAFPVSKEIVLRNTKKPWIFGGIPNWCPLEDA